MKLKWHDLGSKTVNIQDKKCYPKFQHKWTLSTTGIIKYKGIYTKNWYYEFYRREKWFKIRKRWLWHRIIKRTFKPKRLNYIKNLFKYKLAIKKTNVRQKILIKNKVLEYVDRALLILKIFPTKEVIKRLAALKVVRVNSKIVEVGHLLKKYDIITLNLPSHEINERKFYSRRRASHGRHIKFNRGFVTHNKKWLYGKFHANKISIGKSKFTNICFYYNLLKF